MKTAKRLFAVLLAVVMVCTTLPLALAEDSEIIDSGTFGGTLYYEGQFLNSLIWQLDKEGMLTISGFGSMPNYGASSGSLPNGGFEHTNKAPWGQYNRFIKTVVIEEGVTTIGRCCFYGCINLEDVTIPNSVTDIGGNAFSYCSSLKSFIVSESNNYYYSDELGVLFSKDKTILFRYPTGNERSSYVGPDSVITIESESFKDCQNLETVTVPDTVCSLGDNAFNRDFYTGDPLVTYIPTSVLHCNKGSYTASWAENMGYPYALLDGTDEENTFSETINAKLSYSIDRRTRTLTVNNQGKMILSVL